MHVAYIILSELIEVEERVALPMRAMRFSTLPSTCLERTLQAAREVVPQAFESQCSFTMPSPGDYLPAVPALQVDRTDLAR